VFSIGSMPIFFLGIQPNRLNVDSESGLPQALRSWFHFAVVTAPVVV